MINNVIELRRETCSSYLQEFDLPQMNDTSGQLWTAPVGQSPLC